MPKKILYLFLILITTIFILFYLYLKSFVPKNPQYPYFPNVRMRHGEVGWYSDEFQPIYLGSFKMNNKPIIVVAYRGKYGLLSLKSIYVGKEYDSGPSFTNYQKTNNEWVKIDNFDELEKIFNFGEQIRITFFTIVSNSYDPVWNDHQLFEPNKEEATLFCKGRNYLCDAALSTYKYQKKYIEMLDKKAIPLNLEIYAVSLSKYLYDQ